MTRDPEPATPPELAPGPELVREEGDWEGGAPGGLLRMQQVGPTLDGHRDGWRTVTGWRFLDGEPTPHWVTVQIRDDQQDVSPDAFLDLRPGYLAYAIPGSLSGPIPDDPDELEPLP